MQPTNCSKYWKRNYLLASRQFVRNELRLSPSPVALLLCLCSLFFVCYFCCCCGTNENVFQRGKYFMSFLCSSFVRLLVVTAARLGFLFCSLFSYPVLVDWRGNIGFWRIRLSLSVGRIIFSLESLVLLSSSIFSTNYKSILRLASCLISPCQKVDNIFCKLTAGYVYGRGHAILSRIFFLVPFPLLPFCLAFLSASKFFSRQSCAEQPQQQRRQQQ